MREGRAFTFALRTISWKPMAKGIFKDNTHLGEVIEHHGLVLGNSAPGSIVIWI